jgi:hypothetical protein
VYLFKTELSEQEIISRIKAHTYKPTVLSSLNCIVSKTDGRKIILQKKGGLIRHPFQRIFLGHIAAGKNETWIEGRFAFPLISTIVAVLFFCFMIYCNMRAVIDMNTFEQKILATLIFLVFYLVVAFLIVSGKFVYRKQEKEVITFLEKLLKM